MMTTLCLLVASCVSGIGGRPPWVPEAPKVVSEMVLPFMRRSAKLVQSGPISVGLTEDALVAYVP